ncbi:MAG: cation transporting ATPase C-terminal domain-containing protein, partial [Gammaproteobacteria bacterium]
TLALAQLWHVFNMRDDPRALWHNEITRNPWVWAATALCAALIVGAVYLPGVSAVLSLTDPGLVGWLVAVIFSAMTLVLAPVMGIRRRPEHFGNPHSVEA